MAELYLRYQVAVTGRQTAKSALPSPSKSPETGTSPVAPHCCCRSGMAELYLRYQVAVTGRQTAKSALPSPSKSPAIGASDADGWPVGGIACAVGADTPNATKEPTSPAVARMVRNFMLDCPCLGILLRRFRPRAAAGLAAVLPISAVDVSSGRTVRWRDMKVRLVGWWDTAGSFVRGGMTVPLRLDLDRLSAWPVPVQARSRLGIAAAGHRRSLKMVGRREHQSPFRYARASVGTRRVVPPITARPRTENDAPWSRLVGHATPWIREHAFVSWKVQPDTNQLR